MNRLNKKGFISMTTILSFCLVFITLLTLIVLTYENNRVVYGIYKNDIKNVLLERIMTDRIDIADLSSLSSEVSGNTLSIKPDTNVINVQKSGITADLSDPLKYTITIKIDDKTNETIEINETSTYFDIKDYIVNKDYYVYEISLLNIINKNTENKTYKLNNNYYIKEYNETNYEETNTTEVKYSAYSNLNETINGTISIANNIYTFIDGNMSIFDEVNNETK